MMSGASLAVFDLLDRDHDGLVSREDFEALGPGAGAVFTLLDRRHTNSLSRQEVAAATGADLAIFDLIDRNHDGLSRDEFSAIGPGGHAVFQLLDQNHDGALSREEFAPTVQGAAVARTTVQALSSVPQTSVTVPPTGPTGSQSSATTTLRPDVSTDIGVVHDETTATTTLPPIAQIGVVHEEKANTAAAKPGGEASSTQPSTTNVFRTDALSPTLAAAVEASTSSRPPNPSTTSQILPSSFQVSSGVGATRYSEAAIADDPFVDSPSPLWSEPAVWILVFVVCVALAAMARRRMKKSDGGTPWRGAYIPVDDASSLRNVETADNEFGLDSTFDEPIRMGSRDSWSTYGASTVTHGKPRPAVIGSSLGQAASPQGQHSGDRMTFAPEADFFDDLDFS